MPLKVLIKPEKWKWGTQLVGFPSSLFYMTALSLGGEGKYFSSLFCLTPKEARLNLVGDVVNQLSRIFFSVLS
jgi:hypothetical protein